MPINKFLNLAACEIEGTFLNLKGCRGPAAINDVSITYDGSVRVNEKYPKRFWDLCKEMGNGHSPKQLAHVGEVVSPPFDNLDNAKQWMLKYYPDATNSSCGLHFHVSLNNPGYYSCLMEKEFYLYMKESLGKFADEQKLNKIFRERFEGKTEWAKKYCRDEFIPLKQAFVSQKNYNDAGRNRYTLLNFCYGLHETVEIRVFTAHMPVKRAVKCLEWYVNVITEYLEQNYEKFCNTELTTESVDIECDSDNIFAQADESNDDIAVDEFELEEIAG